VEGIMKRFLTLLVLLVAIPAFAGDFPEEYNGERYNEWLKISMQCELVEHNAAWGSILDREDRDVVFFGSLKMDGDILTLDIEWLGRSDGYAPMEAGEWGKDKKFVWDEDEQMYLMIVSLNPETFAFETLTVQENGNVVWWRIGRLEFHIEGWPWWRVAYMPFDEWKCEERKVQPWRHERPRRKDLQQDR
jgi:hypothetical protein